MTCLGYRYHTLRIDDTGLGVGQSRCRVKDADGVVVIEFFSTDSLDDILELMRMRVDNRLFLNPRQSPDRFLDIEEFLDQGGQ